MGKRRAMSLLSILMVLGSLALLFGLGPKLGTDFRGGTEVEVAFHTAVSTGQIRQVVQASGFSSPDVIAVEDPKNPHRFLIRVKEVSSIEPPTQRRIERLLCYGDKLPAAECPENKQATEIKFSPGGDKITARFAAAPDLAWVKARMESIKGISLRPGENNPFLQNPRDHKVEVQLQSKGDQLIQGLKKELGAKAPDTSLRTEWIGPRAGAQLRDAAIKSIVIALIFIMLYVSFRFDIRFAPGGVFALLHDAVGAVGILILLVKELNLTTVAALLTIIGYSVNDTVVIYDRVRENMGKLRGLSFKELINTSTSEMLGRTFLTSGTVLMCLLAFFVWGTGTLKDFALTLSIGIVLGTYSTIYVALPVTEALDRLLFSRLSKGGSDKKKRKASRPRKRQEAVV
jgi:preprotein translocase subunit SecF